MTPTTDLIKSACRAIYDSAKELEERTGDDHIEAVARYAAVDAMRRVADAIGYALIGTEDFSE